MEWKETENGIEVRTEGALAGISRTPAVWYNFLYRVAADGRLEIKVHADVSKNKNACYLPRFGFEFKVPYEMEEMEYFGRRPWENYQDLFHHAPIGLYASDASREYFSYIKPQETGNHTQVRYLTVKNSHTKEELTFQAEP